MIRTCVLLLTALMSGVCGPSLQAQNVWIQSWGPLPVCVNALAVSSEGFVYAGTWGTWGTGLGVLRTVDNGVTWGSMNNELLDAEVMTLLFTREGDLFAGTSKMWRPEGNCLYRSTDGGNFWFPADSGLGDEGMVRALAQDSTGDLFCGPANGLKDVYRSTDDGATWVPTASPQADWPEALLVDRDGMLFSAGFSSVYRTSDGGLNWSKADSGLQAMPLIASLAVNSDGVLFAGMAYGGGVYRSINKGDSWERLPLNSGDVRALTVTPHGVLFVGTWENGIFWSYDNGESWRQDNSGLAARPVRSLVATKDGFVFAGTDSGGIFRSSEPITSVDSQVSLPSQIPILFQNYPNPFNPSTTIRYTVPGRSKVELTVYNIVGQIVRRLVSGEVDAGVHIATFDAAGLSSGMYFYRLKAGNTCLTQRMLLTR